jgi:hypothetical protein
MVVVISDITHDHPPVLADPPVIPLASDCDAVNVAGVALFHRGVCAVDVSLSLRSLG